MDQFKSFVYKEFIHIFRDTRTMMILIAMPVIQIVLFGYAISTEVKNANVAILAPKQDVMVNQVIQRLDASSYFTVSRFLKGNDEIEEAFRSGCNLVVCFDADNTSIQLIADGTEPNQAAMVTQYAQGILQTQIQERKGMSGMQAAMPQIHVHMLYNPQGKSAYNFVPGVMGLVMMLICAMMTSIAIVREKENGTMEVLLASPLPPIIIVIAKMVPYFVLSLVNLTTILLLSRFLLDVPIVGSLILLVGLSILFILLALAFGLLISNIVNSQMAAMLVSGMGLMMPVMLLSGLVFPVESMPRLLQWISCIVPARWFIAAVKKVMIQGCGWGDVTTEMAILTFMLFVILSVALKKFKIRLE